MFPCFQAADEQHGDAFEDLAKCGLVYCAYETGDGRIGRPWRLGGFIVDGYDVELVAVPKQNPFVARRDRERVFDRFTIYAVDTRTARLTPG
jgi:hypothetical protein